MKFTEFNLHEEILTGIAKAGYIDCTPVQEQVLKAALEGGDLYVQSQTGTGKTAAFLTAVIQQLLTRKDVAGKKALIMVPTRELAVQVEQEANLLSSGTKLKCGSFYGGVGYAQQTDMLRQNVDIIVGTPGRVIDLQESGAMDLSAVAFLVIDEADRMFDMGFYPDLRTLIKPLPKSSERQTMLFSATLNTYVKNLAWEYTENAAEITIEAQKVTVDEIDQVLFHVSSNEKTRLLLGILARDKPESVIVFCNTKRTCEIVAKRLRINGIESEFIIGDLPQIKRQQVLNAFKAGTVSCLIATDVAARGIDVNDLAMVVNYDLPNEAENYVHRIGRSARAGKSGKAYTFCSEQDVYNLTPIERYIGKQLPSSMAEQELLAEDKSASVYIKLDTYGDDYEGRPHRGGDNRRDAQGGGRQGARREGRNSGGRGRNSGGENRGSGEYRNENRSGGTGRNSRGEKFSGGSRQPASAARTGKLAEDFSTLPFDERMKIYRKKYASGAGTSTSTSTGTNANGNDRNRRSKNNGGQRRATQTNVSAQKNRQGTEQRTDKARTVVPGAKNSAPARNSAPAKNSAPVKNTAPAKKTGLFTKIKSLFGKK